MGDRLGTSVGVAGWITLSGCTEGGFTKTPLFLHPGNLFGYLRLSLTSFTPRDITI